MKRSIFDASLNGEDQMLHGAFSVYGSVSAPVKALDFDILLYDV